MLRLFVCASNFITGHRDCKSAAAPQGLSLLQVGVIKRLETNIAVWLRTARESAADLDRALGEFQVIDSASESVDDLTSVCSQLLGEFYHMEHLKAGIPGARMMSQ